jgi:hypothetical protein
MMLEQSLISPNFLGKESFRWFIGITTKYKQLDNGGYKAKVRIIGYHPDAASVVKDEELPWAHVLVPLNMGSGDGGTGVSFNSRGSETVIGFFMDGDNGQQPVIIGSLFTGYTIEHPNGFDEGTNGFKPFKAKKDSIKNPLNRSSETGKTNPGGSGIPYNTGSVGIGSTVVISQGTVATDTGRSDKKASNQFVVSIPPTCKSSKSTYSKIIQALRKFIKTLRTIQQVQTGFINPALNTIQDIPGLVQEVSTAISDLFSEYMKDRRDKLIAKIQKWLEKEIDKLLPKDVKLFKQIATDKIIDGIWCVFSKTIQKIGEFVFNFLTQLVGAVSNIPICAAEAFVGSIMSTLTNEVSNALAPVLEEISSTLSPVLGQISNYTSLALGYANQALSFLSCETAECKEALNYQMNKGYIPQETIDGFQKTLNYPSTAIDEGKKAAEQWLGITGGGNSDVPYSYLSATYGYCDAINLDCGLPIIQFFGGGGSGATGVAVVDALGQLMGINIQNSGTGYAAPPYVSIQDPCGNGTGAVATAGIGSTGQVTSVTIENPGSGYLGPNSTTPCTTNPIDGSGSDVIGTIVGVNILNTGVGYASTDLITDIACNSDVEIYPIVDPSGRIIGTNIINPGSAIRVFPQLSINTQDGEGAILQPILSFKPVEPYTPSTGATKKVILCAEDHA